MARPTSGSIQSAEFASFMQAYQDMVFTTIARLTGNDAQAQDLAQDVFLQAYEHFEQLRTSPTAGGWLKTVATHRTLNHLSRYRNRRRLFSELRRPEAEDYEPDIDAAIPDTLLAELVRDQRQALIEQSLRRLPERQRVPLVLYHFETMSYEEIAAQLRISLAKVKIDIHRGRTALARSLTRIGIDADTD